MEVDETPEPDYQTLSRDIQELKDEQRRLREEQERLRHQGDGSNGDHTDTKREPSEQDARKNQRDGNEPGKDGHQEEPQSDGQKHDNQNEPKEQPKPPLKERIRVYVHTYQKQVAIGAVGFVVLCIAGIFCSSTCVRTNPLTMPKSTAIGMPEWWQPRQPPMPHWRPLSSVALNLRRYKQG